jgi:peroxiredoxin Q/BCP
MGARKLSWVGAVVGIACLALGTVAVADRQPEIDLQVGDVAPSFESTNDAAKPWKLEDHVGKKFVVLYFYPADFTTGCTKQAEAWRANMNA